MEKKHCNIAFGAIRTTYGLLQQDCAAGLDAYNGIMSRIERGQTPTYEVIKNIFARAGRDFEAELLDCLHEAYASIAKTQAQVEAPTIKP